MIRKASIIATVALGMAIAAFHGVPSLERIASSARTVQQNFHNLKDNSLNPIERVVFSIMLAKKEAPKLPAVTVAAEMPRT